MIKLTTNKYIVVLTIQTLFLAVDWCINVVSLLTRESNALMLIFFIIQDACLVLALSTLLLSFFSTYVFQTGLVYVLYEKFRTTLLVCMGYFILTTIVNIWLLVMRWNNLKHSWSTSFLMVFVFQRFLATVYYYYYKRAALRISDPRFYEDFDLDNDKVQINRQAVGQATQ